MFHNLKVLIINKNTDDELEQFIHQTLPDAEVIAKTGSLQKALNSLQNTKPDMIFLDSHEPMQNVPSHFEHPDYTPGHPCIMVVASDSKKAREAIEQASFNFITEPIDADTFIHSLDHLHSGNETHELYSKMEKLSAFFFKNRKLKLNTKNGFVMIKPERIVYCEAERNYCSIYLTNGKQELITMQLGQLETKLNPQIFIRINRSITINVNFLDNFNRKNKTVTLISTLQKYEFKTSASGIKKLIEI